MFTGPYMIENDESGKLTGYMGSVIVVRNPNWDESTDYKPAYVDSITPRRATTPRSRRARSSRATT